MIINIKNILLDLRDLLRVHANSVGAAAAAFARKLFKKLQCIGIAKTIHIVLVPLSYSL